jgi:predicted ribosomally synthesized peptide with SipW-like signal peptide
MKKLIVAILVICMVAAAIGIGTWALFSDYETSPDNTFCAGSLDLKIDGNDTPIATWFEIECMQPGDWGAVDMVISNVGCVDGVADIHFKNLIDWEHGIIEPEGEGSLYPDGNPLVPGDLPCEGNSGDPDATGGPQEGELSQYLEFRITADMNAVPVDPDTGELLAALDGEYETTVAALGNLTDIACTNFIYGDLPAESAIGLKIEWWLPETVCNIIMTDCVTFDIEFSLNQKVGEVIGNVTGIEQGETATVGVDYEYCVTVENAGDMGGQFYLETEVQDDGGQTVPGSTRQQLVNLDAGANTTVCFLFTPPSAGSYTVVANPGGVECPFVASEAPHLTVTGIDQPQTLQPCENYTITVYVTNDGGQDAPAMFEYLLFGIADATGNLIYGPMLEPTPPIAVGVTVPITFDFHADPAWAGFNIVATDSNLTGPTQPHATSRRWHRLASRLPASSSLRLSSRVRHTPLRWTWRTPVTSPATAR